MMKLKASVSIYLSIILLSMILLISVLLEKSRINTIQAKCKAAAHMATESVLAGYGKQIFKDYGLLLAWENISVEESLKDYMQANINKADLQGYGTNFMSSSRVDIAECSVEYVTNNHGKGFLEQVKNYVKATGLIDTVGQIIDLYNKQPEKIGKKEENVTLLVDKTSDELIGVVEEIDKDVEILKNKKDLQDIKEDLQNNKNISQIHKVVIKKLNKKQEIILKTIDLVVEYKDKKDQFLKENKCNQSLDDYIEDNLVILEKLKDEIIEIKKLNVSQIIKEDRQSMVSHIERVLLDLEQLKINSATEKDEKNKSIFDKAKNLLNKGVVALVYEDTKHISQNAISTTNLPSRLTKNCEDNLYDKAMLLIFCNNKFGSILKTKKKVALKYEMEYLVAGKSSDLDNLTATIENMLVIRNVVNLGILLSDSGKMTEVSNIATSVAAVTGLPFMEIVAKELLIETWALAESVYEIKTLLKNGTIPVIKTKKDWTVDLDNLLLEPEDNDNKKGLDYISFCNIILMNQPINRIAYRAMDLIQENIKVRYNTDFSMEKCFTKIRVNSIFEVKPLFMAMPWTLGVNKNDDSYSFEIVNENSY